MRKTYDDKRRNEAGMALLLAVILMLLISAIGLGALQSATGESSSGGRSMRKLRTFFAADAGMEVVLRQLDTTQNQYPDISALDDQQFMQNSYGGFTQVRTGTADNDAPQDIRRVASTDSMSVSSPVSRSYRTLPCMP